MDRAALLDLMWREIGPTTFVLRSEFVRGLEGWDLEPKELDGDLVGVAMSKGPEFHFVTFGHKKPITRSLIASCVQPIIDKHGFVRTTTPNDDTRQHRFNLLIGFVVESTDEFFTHFRAEKLKFCGAKSCPL